MRRPLPVLFLVFAVASAHAETKLGDPVRIAVSPAAAPKPSLKFRLYPDRREMAPGNAATLYYRAMASFVENSELLKEIRQQYWYDWMGTPLKDLPMEQVGEKLRLMHRLLHEIELAGRLRDCDWQIEDRPEGFGLLLPEVQGFRNVGVVLAVQARYEIAQGKWDDACRTLQTGYTAARRLGQGPTTIHVLVGGAVARFMDEQVDAMVQQPGAPNLYWALTEMPRPFLDPELAVEQESTMLDRTMPWAAKLDGPPMSDAEAQAAMADMRDRLDEMTKDYGLVEPSQLDKVGQAFFLVQGRGEARRGLLARGKWTAEQLDAMPSFQVVGLYAYLEYRDAQDEMAKWVHAPNGLHHPGFQKGSEKYAQAVGRLDRLFFRGVLGKVFGLADSIGASYRKVYDSAARTDRRFATLEYVEALRMYAAANGKWPDAAADVAEVPLPNDPATGKPFEYQVRENKAVVTAPSLTPGKSDGVDAISYEVFLRN